MKKWIVWVAWEYFVAAELSQRGIIATLTLKNTPSIDILATNLETGKFANIQVKTMSIENNQGWRLWEKDEKNSKIKNHFYILVNLQWESKIPEYYVFHQKILAPIYEKVIKNGSIEIRIEKIILSEYLILTEEKMWKNLLINIGISGNY